MQQSNVPNVPWVADPSIVGGWRSCGVNWIDNDRCGEQSQQGHLAAPDSSPDSGRGFVVVANVLLQAAHPLDEARRLLQTLKECEYSSTLAGLMYTATVLLQQVLDSVARLCEKCAPVFASGCIDVHFHSYPFVQSDFRWVSVHQRRVNALTFEGLSFDAFAHRVCTDELPGLGVVSRGRDGLLSMHDADGKCCVYDLLIPVYKEAVAVVSLLNTQMGQPVPAFIHL